MYILYPNIASSELLQLGVGFGHVICVWSYFAIILVITILAGTLSAYILTIEEYSPLFKLIAFTLMLYSFPAFKVKAPDDRVLIEQVRALVTSHTYFH